MTNSLITRKLLTKDAGQIAFVHHEMFKNFFLTSLGIRFLKSFYTELLLHENGIGIGTFVDGKLIGFAVGTIQTTGFYSSIIKKSGIKLFINAFTSLLLSPKKIGRLLTSLRGGGNNDHSSSPCLLSICVLNSTGLKGIGSDLINAFENELIKLNHNEITLTTDAIDNEHVNEFYLRNNYICMSNFFNGKRQMNFYYKKLKI